MTPASFTAEACQFAADQWRGSGSLARLGVLGISLHACGDKAADSLGARADALSEPPLIQGRHLGRGENELNSDVFLFHGRTMRAFGDERKRINEGGSHKTLDMLLCKCYKYSIIQESPMSSLNLFRTSTIYEWVVEEIAVIGDDRDITDCHYYPEVERAQAESHAISLRATGATIDFGLCRRQGNDHDGDTGRGYAYQDEDGSWPDRFDDGARIPARFSLGDGRPA